MGLHVIVFLHVRYMHLQIRVYLYGLVCVSLDSQFVSRVPHAHPLCPQSPGVVCGFPVGHSPAAYAGCRSAGRPVPALSLSELPAHAAPVHSAHQNALASPGSPLEQISTSLSPASESERGHIHKH